MENSCVRILLSNIAGMKNKTKTKILPANSTFFCRQFDINMEIVLGPN